MTLTNVCSTWDAFFGLKLRHYAYVHAAKVSATLLREILGHSIWKGGDVPWSPRFPSPPTPTLRLVISFVFEVTESSNASRSDSKIIRCHQLHKSSNEINFLIWVFILPLHPHLKPLLIKLRPPSSLRRRHILEIRNHFSGVYLGIFFLFLFFILIDLNECFTFSRYLGLGKGKRTCVTLWWFFLIYFIAVKILRNWYWWRHQTNLMKLIATSDA